MAAVGSYSSLQLIAGAAITGGPNGPAFRANAAVYSLLVAYDLYIRPVGYGNLLANLANAVNNNVISSITAENVTEQIGADPNIAIFNGVMPGSKGTADQKISYLWAGLFENTAILLDLSSPYNRLDSVYSAALGYVNQENQQIFSAVNATNASSQATYQNQNNVSTGGLSQVTLSPQLFAQDVVDLGTAIDLENLTNLGSPEALLKQIALVTRIATPLYNALIQNGIPQNTVDTILASNLSDREQRIVYRVMEQITGSVLAEILGVLSVRTAGLSTLADLLNPIKAFPRSYITLTAPTVNGVRGIYVRTTNNVNSNLEQTLPQYVLKPLDGLINSKNTYASLKKIIPPDQALAWKALQAGLETVTSIQNSILTLFGASTPGMETMKDLDLINALTAPLPSSVSSYYTTNNLGSGPYGSYNIGDVLGVVAAAGAEEVEAVNRYVDSTVQTHTVVDPLKGNLLPLTTQGLYPMINATLNGFYGNNPTVIPAGEYGEGTYGNIQDAIEIGMLGPNGKGKAVSQVVSLGGSGLTETNKLFSVFLNQIRNQENIMNAAGIGFSEAGNIPTEIAYGTFNQLPEYALDTSYWNSAWFFQQIASNQYDGQVPPGIPVSVDNITTLGGQAVLGLLRESRNNERLANAALLTNIVVSDANPDPRPAKLANAQYSGTQAASLKRY